MKKKFTLLIIALFAMGIVYGQADARKKSFNLDKSGLAIKGYDPVAYFTLQKAVEGKDEIALNYKSVTYHFASMQNKDLFNANPGKYEPQYGGWCAYAMGATGEKVEVDPETFKLVDGKLYLFYNSFFNNTKKTWNKDEKNLKTKADVNWEKMYQ